MQSEEIQLSIDFVTNKKTLFWIGYLNYYGMIFQTQSHA